MIEKIEPDANLNISKYTITIPGKPQAKQRARVMKNGFAYTPKKTVNYENWVKWLYIQQVKRPATDKPVKVKITYFHQIPKSTTKKNRALIQSGLLKPTIKPDIDNIMKSILDALNKTAWLDDSQIVSVTAEKVYAEEPKVVVEFKEI